MSTVDGRTRHYGTFYGLPTADDGSRSGLPIALVHGNCQAESVRVLLSGSGNLGVQAIRIPPVFELGARDVPFLQQLAGRAQILISQPVHDDYHDLPLGTSQVLAMMPPGARLLRWPVLRFAGFHPFQAIIRDPADPGRNPPVVPYHDLRTLASARRGADLRSFQGSVAACRSVAESSQAELRRREQRDCDVAISDLFDEPAAGDMATINHPGNRVLIELARRIQRALGWAADAEDPGRRLLGEVIAPEEPAALVALRIPPAATGDPAHPQDWRVGGHPVTSESIHRAQLQWYLENPRVVEAGYLRYQATLETLGLS